MALPQRLAHTREQGFTCAHVALGKVIDDFPIKNTTLTPGFAMYLKRLFAENDLDVAVLGCYLNLATPDSTELAKTIETYKAQIRFASWLGAGVVGTETGNPNVFYAPDPAARSREALNFFIKNLSYVVEYAEKWVWWWRLSRCASTLYTARNGRGRCFVPLLPRTCRSFWIR